MFSQNRGRHQGRNARQALSHGAHKIKLLARSKGFEPLTPRFEVWCSIQLSYERARIVFSGKIVRDQIGLCIGRPSPRFAA